MFSTVAFPFLSQPHVNLATKIQDHTIEMIIHFNGFWPGFLENNNPVTCTFFIDFFGKVFNQSCTIGHNIQEADVLIESMFGSFVLVGVKHWKYSFYYSGENYVPNDSRYTAVLGGTTKYANCIKIPLIIPYMYSNNLFLKFANPIVQTSIPSKFACTVISNSNGFVRNKFIQRLEDRGIHVNHGGRYKNNMGGQVSGQHNSLDMESFFAQHKFAITMENSLDMYYITEKICHGLQAGVIPVYWGPVSVYEYINKERILMLENDSDDAIDMLIDRMVSMSDSEYMDIVKKPIFANPRILDDTVEEVQRFLKLV
jgi:hypothetical protein